MVTASYSEPILLFRNVFQVKIYARWEVQPRMFRKSKSMPMELQKSNMKACVLLKYRSNLCRDAVEETVCQGTYMADILEILS